MLWNSCPRFAIAVVSTSSLVDVRSAVEMDGFRVEGCGAKAEGAGLVHTRT